LFIRDSSVRFPITAHTLLLAIHQCSTWKTNSRKSWSSSFNGCTREIRASVIYSTRVSESMIASVSTNLPNIGHSVYSKTKRWTSFKTTCAMASGTWTITISQTHLGILATHRKANFRYFFAQLSMKTSLLPSIGSFLTFRRFSKSRPG